MKEQALYQPIKTLFEHMGYSVYGEVKTIDVVAKQGTTVLAIELKLEFSLTLIAQGTYRQKLTDFVYLSIPKPTTKVMKGHVYKDKINLLKRLGLGLIFVQTSKEPYTAHIILEPSLTNIKIQQTRNKHKRTALLNEIKNRHSNFNIGGTRGKIMTAYKEAMLGILVYFKDGKSHTTKEIRTVTGNKKATRMLYDDHYNWFIKEDKGCYMINQNGKDALKEYKEVIKIITS